jgi:hypothetical protein
MLGTDYEGEIMIQMIHKIIFKDGTVKYINEPSSKATPKYFNPEEYPSIMKVKKERNPGAAFIMSLFIPGAGQMYNHQVGKGLAIFWSGAIFLTGAIILTNENIVKSNSAKAAGIALGVVFLGVYIYNLCDAPITARKINQEKGFTNLLFQHDLHLNFCNEGVGLALRF